MIIQLILGAILVGIIGAALLYMFGMMFYFVLYPIYMVFDDLWYNYKMKRTK